VGTGRGVREQPPVHVLGLPPVLRPLLHAQPAGEHILPPHHMASRTAGLAAIHCLAHTTVQHRQL
jgi:hypothetical protein